MAVTIEMMRRAGFIVQEAFPRKSLKCSGLRGMFSDVGRDLRKRGLSSVDLVRELRDQ